MNHAFLVTERQSAAQDAYPRQPAGKPVLEAGVRDTAAVDVRNWHSMQYWAKWLGISEQQLIRATRIAGTNVALIEAASGRTPRTPSTQTRRSATGLNDSLHAPPHRRRERRRRTLRHADTACSKAVTSARILGGLSEESSDARSRDFVFLRAHWLHLAGATALRGSADSDRRPRNPSSRSGNARLVVSRGRRSRARQLRTRPAHAKNVIVFLGDGMSITTITAARILDGQRNGDSGEENRLSFENFPATALSAHLRNRFPDPRFRRHDDRDHERRENARRRDRRRSARRARQLRIGPRQRNRQRARACRDGRPVDRRRHDDAHHACDAGRDVRTHRRSRLGSRHGDSRKAARAGLRRPRAPARRVSARSTASTSRSAAAAPNSCRPISAIRNIRQLPGKRLDGRDLIADWTKRAGAAYVWNETQLEAIDPAHTTHLLGLFEPEHMHYETERAKDAARRAEPFGNDAQRAVDPEEKSERIFPDGRRRPHRPRPPRRQCVSRADRDDRIRERGRRSRRR